MAWQEDDSASEDPAMWRRRVVADVSTAERRGNVGKLLNREGTSRAFEDTGLR